MLDGGRSVVDDNSTSLAVELEEALSCALVGVEGADSEELDGEDLSSFDLDGHLLIDLGLAEEVASGEDREVAVALDKVLVLVEDLIM